MTNCNNTPPCEQNDCLGCSHYHSSECITLETQVGNQPTGTDLTTVLTNFWNYFQNNLANEGVGIQSAAVDGNGNLIITLTNGTTINAGLVKGTNGTNGVDGADGTNGTNGVDGADGVDGIGIDNITTDGYGNITITYTDTTTQVIDTLSPRIHFGNSHDNPNTATSITPLVDYFTAVVDNKTTIIPRINTTYFNIDTKEMWTYDGTLWINPMSIGTHLEESSFSHTYNSVASSSTTNIINYTTDRALENGESYTVKFSGYIYSNVILKVEIYDGTTPQNIGIFTRQGEGDPYRNRFSVTVDIFRKSPTAYVTRIDGMVQADTGVILQTPAGAFLPFTRTISTGNMDTTIPLDINIFGISTALSPVQSDAIVIETFSVIKNKY